MTHPPLLADELTKVLPAFLELIHGKRLRHGRHGTTTGASRCLPGASANGASVATGEEVVDPRFTISVPAGELALDGIDSVKHGPT